MRKKASARRGQPSPPEEKPELPELPEWIFGVAWRRHGSGWRRYDLKLPRSVAEQYSTREHVEDWISNVGVQSMNRLMDVSQGKVR